MVNPITLALDTAIDKFRLEMGDKYIQHFDGEPLAKLPL
jgi:hypothetical protein